MCIFCNFLSSIPTPPREQLTKDMYDKEREYMCVVMCVCCHMCVDFFFFKCEKKNVSAESGFYTFVYISVTVLH
jgi:hypothetical protein